ncbi:dihydrofolate reductase family protein [Bacillus massilinigeriensis]|uniref:dihydrofolate reductase family protein n=1 Tax=Bacillus mediterraneensis TaxID=1805474 RepID=UPI0008F8B713|nr:dihydrofolate reductase family protein [Bacillus mediterraneensis]
MVKHDRKRKVLLDLAVSLDGFIEGPNGETDWCIMDSDMDFKGFLNRIDTILYGRKSYDIWGNYNPVTKASETEKEIWELVHSKKKYVFSKTQKGSKDHVTFINENIVDEIRELKNKPGRDIWLYGGASLITAFVNLGLVDEFRLSVHPIVLGAGKPLFIDMKQRVNLKLVENKSFSSGVVQLCYHLED